ncbi:hypothetical protein QF042_002921 [Pedobacter sp. W3I1]|uniref:hypothetical protein n=1 Tax=Pedobacter sp. W3I1 TaxID=3042291 RepID=UPI0027814794|nr:hypothetical protein [Pedobacter sp. W3I1]MDQ0639356.1 hypothetical protein [Pedobacter sp. W3I1]
MKTKKIMMFSGILCFFLLTGLTRAVAQDVEVPIYLPYSGNYNDWYITFTKVGTTESYYFHTDDDTFESKVLGTLPAGNYDIEFQSSHFPNGFDFGIWGNETYSFKIRSDGFIWYGVTIDQYTSMAIDEGY